MSRLSAHTTLWLVVLAFPALPGLGGTDLAQKLLHAVGVVTVVLLIVLTRRDRIDMHAVGYLCATFGLFVAYYAFTTLAFTRAPTGRDMADVIRPVVYGTYALFPLLVPLGREEFARLLRAGAWVVIGQVVFSALVHVPLAWPLVDMFKGRPSGDMPLHFYRWSGTFGYPSDFSFFLSLPIYFVFAKYRAGIAPSRLETTAAAFAVIGVLMSFSRGGIFSIVIMLGLAAVASGALKRARTWIMAGALAGVVTVGLATADPETLERAEQVQYLLQAFGDSESGARDSSTNHRLNELEIATELAARHAPFGTGANRAEIGTRIEIVESFYGFHLMKWGWLGTAAFAGFLLGTAVLTYDRVRRRGGATPNERALVVAYVMIVLSIVLLFGWSSAVSDRFKGLPLFYLLTGYVLQATCRGARTTTTVASRDDEAPTTARPSGAPSLEGAAA
jgi:hypothetical protein